MSSGIPNLNSVSRRETLYTDSGSIVSKCRSVLFEGAAQSLPMAANPVAAGSQPMSSAAPSSQAADKYSAIADLESVFSSTSIGSGFTYQSAGVNWGGGGAGAAVWAPQPVPYQTDNTGQAVNLGQAMPQMFAVNNPQNPAVTPPSYATVAGN